MASNPDQLAIVRRLSDEKARLSFELETLKAGGGSGTSGGVDVIDAKIAAAEARTDTKFAELRAELQRLPGKGTIWGAVATALAIVMAVLAFAGSRFDSGMSARGAVDYTMSQQRDIDAKQDARAAATDKKLDAILARLPAK